MRARHLSLFLTALLLLGCPRLPALTPATSGSASPPTETSQLSQASLTGQVDLSAFKVQGTITEIAAGATIALIDSQTGYTLGSTVSKPDGRFVLAFSNGFKPTLGKVYYLEALKGLMAGTDLPNRIGSPVARVRTLLEYQVGGWVSASSNVPGSPVSITSTTTALSLIASLRATTAHPVPMLSLIGSLPNASDPASFTKVTESGISLASLQQVVSFVRFALEDRDRDPFRSVLLDVSDPSCETFVIPNLPFTISYLSPPSAAIGEELFIVGDSFDPLPANNTVTFTGSGNTRLTAPVTSVSADHARLRVVVPIGATNGLLSVQIGNLLLNSPVNQPFQLASRDGHRIVDDSGNLYVANSAYGTLSKISPQGATTPLITGLATPLRGITLGTDGTLYVISGDAILNYTTTGTLVGTVVASGATGAWGLAFSPAGELFVSMEATNLIAKVSTGALTTVSISALLSRPRGISFGPDGQLYVANYGNDTVVSVAPTTGATTLFQSGFSRPWSLAFDTFGVMYVTNNAGNSVYRVDGGVIKPFASVQSPGGIDADPSGYLYVADNASNRIYRIDTSGLSYVLAEGISYPKGLGADAAGNFYVANSQNHSVIRITPDGTVTTVARGFNDPSGVALDSARNHLYVSDLGDGSVTRIDLTDGSFATVLRNLTSPSGIAYDGDRLYVYQPTSADGATVYAFQPEVQEYDVTTSPYALTRTLRSALRNNQGIAFDAAANALYVTLPMENAVTRIDRATGVMQRVAVTAPSPEDVAVDGAGRVYVACKGTSTADDALQVFTWNAGTKTLDLTATLTDANIDRPTTIGWDGSAIYFGNSSTDATSAGSIHRLDSFSPASYTAIAAGVTKPTGLAFSTTAGVMWVAGGNKVVRVNSYATAPSLAAAFNRSGVLDVGATADGTSLQVMGGAGIFLTDPTGSNFATYARDFIRGGARMTPDGSGQYFVTSIGAGIYQTTGTAGNGRAIRHLGWSTTDMLSLYWLPTIAVGSTAGNRWLVVPRGGSWDGALSRLNLASGEEIATTIGWDYDTPHGAAWDPATGKAWSVSYNNGRGQRTNAAGTGLELNAVLDPSYQGFGAVFTGGYFYATLYTHHRIDRFSPSDTNGASRTPQPFGLGGPEL